MKPRTLLLTALLATAAACSPPAGGDGDADADADTDGDVEPADCTPGDIVCRGNEPRMCNEAGDAYVPLPACGGETPTCVEGRGCMACAPLQRDCQGDVPRQCNDLGEWVSGTPCNSSAGEICQWGSCLDPCDAAAAVSSYVGCEYWAVDLPNAQQASGLSPRDAQFSVVVSNGHETATAHVEVFGSGDDATPVLSVDVPPSDLRILPINPTRPPSETNVAGTGVHQRRAFRIVSNVPVTAYQFNPLNNTEAAYSNDASLLLPVNGLGQDYIVATGDGLTGSDSGNPTISYPWGAFVTVVAVEDDTEVTIEPTNEVQAGGDVPAGREAVVRTLSRYDVLNLESTPTDTTGMTPGNANLSGTRVRASRPVAVFAGNVATIMPYGPEGDCCADHLEEQFIPLSAWGQDFLVARGLPRRYEGTPEPEYYRITGGNLPAGLSTISLTYAPAAPPGAPAQLVEGESVEFSSTADFIVQADGPILVTSFFVSSQITTGGEAGPMCFRQEDCNGLGWAAVCFNYGFGGECVPVGDPSMTIIPPVEQFRDSYVFLAPDDYAHDAVTVIAPMGAALLLDGAAMSGLTVVGEIDGTTWGVLRQEIPDGTHRLTVGGGVQAGLIVYGMDKDVSYGYPGGLDLEAINPIG